MRRTSLDILVVAFAGLALAACETTPPATVQRQAPSVPVVAGFGKTPITAGFGNDPVTGSYHETQGVRTYRP